MAPARALELGGHARRLYLNYDKFPCKNCGNKSEDNKKHYFGPTQAAVSLIYLF